MYYFVEALDNQTYNYLEEHFGYSDSSDLRANPEGWCLTEEQMNVLPETANYQTYDIPKKYQDDIEEFKTLYWDGDFRFRKKRNSI